MSTTIERRHSRRRPAPLEKRFSDLSVGDIWDFHRSVHLERQLCGFLPDEEARLFDVKCGHGTILSRHAYYRQMYCRPMLRALRTIFGRFPRPRILDLGCGTGTQAIFFGLLGASVVALDLDEGQLRTLQKRVARYDALRGDRLPIAVEQADMRACDFTRWGTFDAVYSHMAAGYVLSAEECFCRLAPCLAPGGLLVMKNCNPRCWWLRATGARSDNPSRRQYLDAARRHGFTLRSAQGSTGIPRPLWLLGELMRIPDALLRRLRPFQVTIEYVFERALPWFRACCPRP